MQVQPVAHRQRCPDSLPGRPASFTLAAIFPNGGKRRQRTGEVFVAHHFVQQGLPEDVSYGNRLFGEPAFKRGVQTNEGEVRRMLNLKRILAATDLSVSGRHAIMRAAQLAKQWGASLHVVHARPDWNLYARWRPASADGYQLIARRADHLLAELQNDVAAEFGVSPQWSSRLGRASDVIAAMVAEHDPNLVVIGARGEHASDEAVPRLGGTALKLPTRFGQPLLLVRGASPTVYTRSVVCVDAPTPLARRAVLWGTSLVRGGESHLVHAYYVPYAERMHSRDVSTTEDEGQLKQAADGGKATLAEVKGAAETGVQVQTHAVNGEPVAAVLGEITRRDAQLVVIGKRNLQRSLVLSGALGSVGFRIADQAPVDVLILS
jgi:nucleotide-binding universal stress UspA family protein